MCAERIGLWAICVSVGASVGVGVNKTVVLGAVTVAAMELPLIYLENSIDDFGVDSVFEKDTNFSKTHVETGIRVPYNQ